MNWGDCTALTIFRLRWVAFLKHRFEFKQELIQRKPV